jgi:predicted MFS family arabinose efflux permease
LAILEEKDHGTEKNGNPWVILVVISLGLLSFATSFQSVPPILPLLVEEFGFTHAQAGSLMSFFCLVGVFISIPAGMLADRKKEEPRIFYTFKAGHKTWIEISSEDFWYPEHL